MEHGTPLWYTAFMATSDEHPPSTVEHEPSLADAAAVGRAAGEAASRADSSAQAREDAREAVERTAQERSIALSESDISKIVDGLISNLEARGVFDREPVPEPPATAATTAVGEGEGVASGPLPDAEPKRRTFADRFMSKGGSE